MKLIIAGSRRVPPSYFWLKFLDREVSQFTKDFTDPTEIVSGCATGVDTLGEMWAKSNGVFVKRFEPFWGLYGNSARNMRNTDMAEYGEGLIALPCSKSKGTWDMVLKAETQSLVRTFPILVTELWL